MNDKKNESGTSIEDIYKSSLSTLKKFYKYKFKLPTEEEKAMWEKEERLGEALKAENFLKGSIISQLFIYLFFSMASQPIIFFMTAYAMEWKPRLTDPLLILLAVVANILFYMFVDIIRRRSARKVIEKIYLDYPDVFKNE